MQRDGFIDLFKWATRRQKHFVPRMQQAETLPTQMDDSAHGGNGDLGIKLGNMRDSDHIKLADMRDSDQVLDSKVPGPTLSADQRLQAEQERAELDLRAKLHGGRI